MTVLGTTMIHIKKITYPPTVLCVCVRSSPFILLGHKEEEEAEEEEVRHMCSNVATVVTFVQYLHISLDS